MKVRDEDKTASRGASPARRRRGYSILELMVVVTLMSIILSLAAPSFQTAMEQSRADIAVANLRAIWTAQRYYLVVNPQQTDPPSYTANLSDLQSFGLLDPTLISATSPYEYSIALPGDGSVGFTATATRTGTGAGAGGWQGSLTIDQDGNVSGSVLNASGFTIVPASQ